MSNRYKILKIKVFNGYKSKLRCLKEIYRKICVYTNLEVVGRVWFTHGKCGQHMNSTSKSESWKLH